MRRRTAGFTLIELVMVIVLLAIVATVSVQFVTHSASGALDTGARQQRALVAAVVSEQLSRALRQALPASIRVFDNGHCIEWMPIEAASTYLTLPTATAATSFSIVPLADPSATTGRVVVYPYSGDVYTESDPGPLSPAGTVESGNVTLSAAHQFDTGSPEQRFFVVGEPVSVCQSGRRLYRYVNYGVESAAGTGHLQNGAVLADNLSLDAATGAEQLMFSFQQPTLNRNAVVHFSFRLGDAGGEVLNVDQEVQIRNVP